VLHEPSLHLPLHGGVSRRPVFLMAPLDAPSGVACLARLTPDNRLTRNPAPGCMLPCCHLHNWARKRVTSQSETWRMLHLQRECIPENIVRQVTDKCSRRLEAAPPRAPCMIPRTETDWDTLKREPGNSYFKYLTAGGQMDDAQAGFVNNKMTLPSGGIQTSFGSPGSSPWS
jgi:hypothetical protein